MNESTIFSLLASYGFQNGNIDITVLPDERSLTAALQLVNGLEPGAVVRWEVPTMYLNGGINRFADTESPETIDITWQLSVNRRVEVEAVFVTDFSERPCLVVPRSCFGDNAKMQLFANFWREVSGVTYWGHNDECHAVKFGVSPEPFVLESFSSQASPDNDPDLYAQVAPAYEAFATARQQCVDPAYMQLIRIVFELDRMERTKATQMLR